MHVISRPALSRFQAEHADAREWLANWWSIATTAVWTSLADVHRAYPAADQVGG
jgi:mRNA-degrading endonuclease HigB of HigAB toxin-antitoxin module